MAGRNGAVASDGYRQRKSKKLVETNMDKDAPVNAHRFLIERIALLREFVHARIPKRYQHLISVDDVLQDVWISAHRTFKTMQDKHEDEIDCWLRTMSKRRLIDALRAVRAVKRGEALRFVIESERRTTSLCRLFSRLASRGNTPSRDVRAEEVAHTVGISLAALPEERREAIKLRFVDGLSHREIASQLHKSESAVNSLLFNGLRQLRTLLGEANRYLSA